MTKYFKQKQNQEIFLATTNMIKNDEILWATTTIKRYIKQKQNQEIFKFTIKIMKYFKPKHKSWNISSDNKNQEIFQTTIKIMKLFNVHQ